jgi:hypothetical protein
MAGPGRPTWSQQMTILRRPLLDAIQEGHATAVAADGLGARDRERIHEDAFFRVATALEHFMTDWLVRALADDPSYLIRRLTTALQADAAARYVAGLELGGQSVRVMRALDVLTPKLTVEVPAKSKLRLQDARSVIGVEDSALSMRSFDEYARLAEQLVAASRKPYLLGLDLATRSHIDVAIKLRHAVAHRSDRAADDLNGALQGAALRNELRIVGTAGGRITAARVGRYLVARRGGWMRTCWLLDDLATTAYTIAKTTGRHRIICDCEAR